MAEPKTLVVPNPRMSRSESYCFTVVAGLCCGMLLRSAFLAFCLSAVIGWAVAALLTALTWRLYAQARKLYVDNMIAAHIIKASGLYKQIRR